VPQRLPPVVPPVVSPQWLEEHAGEVVVADVRWYLDGRSGRAAYDAGHLPGAVFVDLDRWLSDAGAPPERGRHPLPDPAVFAEGMARSGVSDDTVVVGYDDAGGTVAARMVWMLRATGHPAALLDGGLDALPGPLSTEPATPGRGDFTPRAWPDDVLADLETACSPDVVLLDARDADRYRGVHEPVDPKAGHVPGARNLPSRGNVDERGRLLPVEALRARFREQGVDAGSPVVASCGSGVTACHTLLVLEHVGLGAGRLWPGSWSEYSHSCRPVATGDAASP
jgi:thiosulfate/3-mercaptopyruvate sulfurtransferase